MIVCLRLLVVVAGVTLAGCTSTQTRLAGAGVGAGAGAVVAGPIGAIAGGVIGAATAPAIARPGREGVH